MVSKLEKDIIDVLPEIYKNQRNWDLSREVSEEHIELFKKVVYYSPSHEQNTYYNTHFVTNRDLIQKIYENSDGSGPARHQEISDARQPQLLANLVVIFESYVEHTGLSGTEYYEESLNENITRDRNLAIGVAAGALISVAHMLGYKTSYNIYKSQESQWMIEHLMDLNEKPIFIIGIGYGNHKMSHNRHHNDRNIKYGDYARNPLPKMKTWE